MPPCRVFEVPALFYTFDHSQYWLSTREMISSILFFVYIGTFIEESNNIPIWHFSSEIFMYLFLEWTKVKGQDREKKKFTCINLHTILDVNMKFVSKWWWFVTLYMNASFWPFDDGPSLKFLWQLIQRPPHFFRKSWNVIG